MINLQTCDGATVTVSIDEILKAAAAVSPVIKKQLHDESVLSRVCAYYNVTPDEVRERSRGRGAADDARKVAAYIYRTAAGMSYPEIGDIMHRCHQTIMSNVRAVRADIGRYTGAIAKLRTGFLK